MIIKWIEFEHTYYISQIIPKYIFSCKFIIWDFNYYGLKQTIYLYFMCPLLRKFIKIWCENRDEISTFIFITNKYASNSQTYTLTIETFISIYVKNITW